MFDAIKKNIVFLTIPSQRLCLISLRKSYGRSGLFPWLMLIKKITTTDYELAAYLRVGPLHTVCYRAPEELPVHLCSSPPSKHLCICGVAD